MYRMCWTRQVLDQPKPVLLQCTSCSTPVECLPACDSLFQTVVEAWPCPLTTHGPAWLFTFVRSRVSKILDSLLTAILALVFAANNHQPPMRTGHRGKLERGTVWLVALVCTEVNRRRARWLGPHNF